jgi:hypothetical protein
VLVSAIVLVADLRGAIGFSSFAVLTYYALANASAWRLTERGAALAALARRPRASSCASQPAGA